VEFDPKAFIVGIDKAVSMASIPVYEAVALRQASVAHQDGHLVQRFR